MEENNYMSEKEKAIIEDNLRAYENNFGYIKIVKEECGLYGCVQAANGVMKKIAKK